jgi:uncharacterized protein (TIGR02145 family)
LGCGFPALVSYIEKILTKVTLLKGNDMLYRHCYRIFSSILICYLIAFFVICQPAISQAQNYSLSEYQLNHLESELLELEKLLNNQNSLRDTLNDDCDIYEWEFDGEFYQGLLDVISTLDQVNTIGEVFIAVAAFILATVTTVAALKVLIIGLTITIFSSLIFGISMDYLYEFVDDGGILTVEWCGISPDTRFYVRHFPDLNECGAYVAPGVWKEFDCYNLAAIGKTTNDDPFTPSWRLIGGYWQWGRKGPSSSQWYDTNTPNFAHGPTGPGISEANEGEIRGWGGDYAPDGSWSDSEKTANDPCPAGFRVPTIAQWEGVNDNNTQSTVGTWDSNDTNYSSARFFGSDLMLPAAGHRESMILINAGDSDYGPGMLYKRGYLGCYWSSSESSSSSWFLSFASGGASTSNFFRWYGYSVRCVAE